MNYAGRREQLRRLLKKQKNAPPALLVTSEANVCYLTGFTGDSSYLLLTADDQVVISDRRYTTQLEDECPDLKVDVRGPEVKMPDQVAGIVKKMKLASVGFDPANVSVALHETLTKAFDNIEFVAAGGLVEQLRMIKDKDEVLLIREAIHVAQRSFEVIRASLRPEQSEKQVGDAMEMQVRLFGGECTAFTPIVGVGPNAALPHYRPGKKKIGEAELVLIDWGARVGGYVSDLTRVLVTSKISPKLRKVYGVVSIAQQRAIEKIRAGVSMKEVDAAARDYIAKSGFGKYFGHGLGHGIGLQIHEAPRMGPLIDEPLQAGMVVTVEPGVYLPGIGGVRIEDDVLVTKNGHEVLSDCPKELDACVVGS
jgi:Xaa-Pro aminopeptidase